MNIPQKMKEKIPEKYKIDNLPLIGRGAYKDVYKKGNQVVLVISPCFDYEFSFKDELYALEKLKEIGLPYIPYLDYDEITYNGETLIFALAELYENPNDLDLENIKNNTDKWSKIIINNNLYFADLQIMKKNDKFFLHDPGFCKKRTTEKNIYFYVVLETLDNYICKTLNYYY